MAHEAELISGRQRPQMTPPPARRAVAGGIGVAVEGEGSRANLYVETGRRRRDSQDRCDCSIGRLPSIGAAAPIDR
jgi:hypothetical protein